MSNVKTNAMRILDKHKIAYKTYCYAATGAVSGTEVAAALGQNPAQVFKTLVTTGKSGTHYVFMLPVAAELDLKKPPAPSMKIGGNAETERPSPLNRLCSRRLLADWHEKQFPTVVDQTAAGFPTIIFSAGMIGYQVELPLPALKTVIPLTTADITAA